MSPAARPEAAIIEARGTVNAAKRGLAASTKPAKPPRPTRSALEGIEEAYRDNVDSVLSFFARRCQEAQTVADLTSETFVRAAESYGKFDRTRGTVRAWLFGIAGHVFARHCQEAANGRRIESRLAGHQALESDEVEELTARIDDERAGRGLLERFARLPEIERVAIELVDLEELTPKEAAAALDVSRVALRQRLSRARARLRKEHGDDE